jgi:hypothetical protein
VSSDPGDLGSPYTSMQQQAGLMPAFVARPLPSPLPGQVSAMIAQMGSAGAFAAISQAQQMNMPGFTSPSFSQPMPNFAGQPPMMPGPGGMFMPMMPGAAASPYSGAMGAMSAPPMGMGGPQMPPGNMYGAGMMAPPPAYRGPMGQPMGGFFSPPAPSPFFETPYQAGLMQSQATDDRRFSMGMGSIGVGGRLLGDLAGAAGGAMLGRRAGIGGGLGALGGFLGAEFGGVGQGAQNLASNWFAAPMAALQSQAAGIQEMSRGFAISGSNLGPMGQGGGFSRPAAMEAARGMREMATSDTFQRETAGRFNTQDVMRIGQAAGQEGLMAGVGSPQQMVSRVREVAQAVQAFMELANEPDVRRAIQVMGQMRAQGLNLQETTAAVAQGRSFARMAGMSFEQMMNTGGAMGAGTFQSMGLTQGLGAQVGMGAMGRAAASVNSGVLNPQMSNLVGGPQGLAAMNTMFSGGFLQMPMMAPGMMTGGGGINPQSVAAMMQGRLDPTQMAGMGANNLSTMAGRQGTGGLAMALGMQPMLQDQIGRMMAQAGPNAQRFAEDRMARGFGQSMFGGGAGGMMGGLQLMGMSGSQAAARVQELGSETYWTNLRGQADVRRRERGAVREREEEARAPSGLDELTMADPTGAVGGIRRGVSAAGGWLRGARDWAVGGGPRRGFFAEGEDERREFNRVARGPGFSRVLRDIEGAARPRELAGGDLTRQDRAIMEARGGRGIVAGIAALFPMDAGVRRAELENIQGVGEMAREVGRGGSAAALGQMGRTFGAGAGGMEALQAFSGQAAGLFGGEGVFGGRAQAGMFNLAMRGAETVASRYLSTGGNIAGRGGGTQQSFENAFVQSMQGRGQSESQLRQTFRQNRTTIMQQAAPLIEISETASQRQDRNVAERRMGDVGNTEDTGFMRATAERESSNWRTLLGTAGDNVRLREASRQASRTFEGTAAGETNPERRARLRALMGTMAQLQQVTQRGEATNPDDARRASEQLRRLGGQIQQEFGNDRLIEVNRTLREHRNDPRLTTSDALEAGIGLSRNLGTRSGAQMANIATTARHDDMAVAAAQNLAYGVGRMGLQSVGAMGRAFARGDIRGEGAFTETRFRDVISTMSQEDLSQLGREEGGREMAQLVRGAQRGDERSYAALRSVYAREGGMGERARAAREQFANRGVWSQVGDWVRRRVGAGGTEESAIQQAVGRGTAEDVRGAMEEQGITAEQESTRRAGVGGDNDAFRNAVDTFDQASRRLLQAAESGQIEGLVSGGGGAGR